MRPIKVRFKTQILADVLPPRIPSNRAVVLLSGMPSSPFKNHVLNYWSKKEYWAINPRYRGTWESEGLFLEKSPEQDVFDIVNELPKTLKDEWNGIEIEMPHELEIFIVGVSFGGATAILSSKHEKIRKVVALTPVTDFKHPSKDEPLDQFPQQVKAAFGDAIRMATDGWKNIMEGKILSPINSIDGMDSSKILILHTEDDSIVDIAATKSFTEKVGNQLKIFKKGGHLGIAHSTKRPYRKYILKFLKS